MAEPISPGTTSREFLDAVTILRLRKVIAGDPQKVAHDPEIFQSNALAYGLAAPVIGLVVASFLTVVASFFEDDHKSIWKLSVAANNSWYWYFVSEPWYRIGSLLLSWSVGPVNFLSSVAVASIMSRWAIKSGYSDALPIDEIRRRYFMSHYSTGFIHTIIGTSSAVLLTWAYFNNDIFTSLLKSYNESSSNFLLPLWLERSRDFQVWLASFSFSSADQIVNSLIVAASLSYGPELSVYLDTVKNIAKQVNWTITYVIGSILTGLAILFYSFFIPVIATGSLFARAVNERAGFEVSRGLALWFAFRIAWFRFVTMLFTSVMFFIVGSSLYFLFWLGGEIRCDLNLSSPFCLQSESKKSEPVKAETPQQVPCPECRKPPVEAFATRYVIYFEDNTAEILEQAKPELDAIAAQFKRLTADFSVKVELTAFLTKREENKLKSEIEAVRQARAAAVRDALVNRADSPIPAGAVEIVQGQEARLHTADDLPFNLMQRVAVQLVLSPKPEAPVATPEPAAPAASPGAP